MSDRRRSFLALHRAFDEACFGAAKTLNLRASLPSPYQAVTRAEAWLRERQVARAGEVLVITGRGSGSADGVSVVRAEVERLLLSLRRRGVVSHIREHTPGSFVVRLAPLSAIRESPRRKQERPAPPPDPAALEGLDASTRLLLRRLALRALETLGVRQTAGFVESEMVVQFAGLAAGVPEGPDRESRLRAAIQRALEEYEGG